MPILQLQKACLAFGHIPLLNDADLIVDTRERVCLIGRNGTGKSSLLNVLNSEQVLDSGKLWLEDGIKIAKLAQANATSVDGVAATCQSQQGGMSEMVTAAEALTQLADELREHSHRFRTRAASPEGEEA